MSPEDLELTLKILKSSGARSAVYVSGDVRVEATFDPPSEGGSISATQDSRTDLIRFRPRFPTGTESLR